MWTTIFCQILHALRFAAGWEIVALPAAALVAVILLVLRGRGDPEVPSLGRERRYTYEDYRRDLRDPSISIEEILERLEGEVPRRSC
jgi:hypothetical protein